jgi:hypothetical protein
VLVMTFDCIIKGNSILEKTNRTKGKVIDQVSIRTNRLFGSGREVPRPQIEFVVRDDTVIFVDHNASLRTGKEPTIIYLKENPHMAQVYDFWFWINLADIIPGLLISILVFRVMMILNTKYKDDPVIIPSNTPL